MKIKKGDTVKILKGKDRGKSGKVIRVFPAMNKVLVEGLNLYKKHVRPKRQGEKGEVVEIAKPLAAANVALLCPHCKQATRVGYKLEGIKKFRYCKKCKNNV
jgi:large subunit ribosomal protein L24